MDMNHDSFNDMTFWSLPVILWAASARSERRSETHWTPRRKALSARGKRGTRGTRPRQCPARAAAAARTPGTAPGTKSAPGRAQVGGSARAAPAPPGPAPAPGVARRTRAEPPRELLPEPAPAMGVGYGGMRCIKILLFIFNLTFWVSAARAERGRAGRGTCCGCGGPGDRDCPGSGGWHGHGSLRVALRDRLSELRL